MGANYKGLETSAEKASEQSKEDAKSVNALQVLMNNRKKMNVRRKIPNEGFDF
jgi:hypothetical protein